MTAKRSKPAMDPASREKQLIAKAYSLAERQLDDGTASPSTINHFLKLATEKEIIEKENLRSQNKLLEAKVSSLENQKDAKVVYDEALAAMKNYGAK